MPKSLVFLLALLAGSIFFCSSLFAQSRDTLSITTYYPAPEVDYQNIETADLYSPNTEVSNEFRKQVSTPSGDRVNIFRAFVNPLNSVSASALLQSQDNFTSRDINDPNMPLFLDKPGYIHDFLFNNTTNPGDPIVPNIGMILNRVNALNITGSGASSRIVTGNIEHLLSLQVRGTTSWQEYNNWPGQGQCRTRIAPFFGFLATNCNSGEVLSDFWESPMGSVIAWHIGGGAHEWNNDTAIGLGGGLKSGLYGWTCCQTYQDNTPAPLNLPCQDLIGQLDFSGPLSPKLTNLFNDLAKHSSEEGVFSLCGSCVTTEKTHCYASVSPVTYDAQHNITNTCGTNEIGIAMDVRKPTWVKKCVCTKKNKWGICVQRQCQNDRQEYRVGSDGIDEYYCFSYDSIMGKLPGDDQVYHVPCMITALEAVDGPTDTNEVPAWLNFIISLFPGHQTLSGLPDMEGVFSFLNEGLGGGVSNDAICDCFAYLENTFGNWGNVNFENAITSQCH